MRPAPALLRALVALLAFLACIAMASCRPREARADVLLLLVDTLRADHLSLYGYERPTSPELDRFAAQATVFEHVVTPAPWTLPAVGSLLTGTYPSVHGLRAHAGDGHSTRMREGLPTLAEEMAEAGYRTVAIVANPWVNTPDHGLQRGFEEYHEVTDGSADDLNALAREKLAADDGRPSFLYVHYMDVHGPYPSKPDPGERDLGPVPESYRRPLSAKEKRSMPPYLKIAGGERLDDYVSAYDRGIARWDRKFGELADWLEANDRLRRTIVMVTSDHGEELLEHGGWNHGYALYEEQLAVPWLIRLPDGAGRRVHDRIVGLLDLAPTLLALVGRPAPESMVGIDVLADAPATERAFYSRVHIAKGAVFMKEGDHRVAMRRGSRKWITDAAGDRCFDLRSDPGETRHAECEPAGFDEVRRWARRFQKLDDSLGDSGDFELPPERRARLEALGYLDGNLDGNLDSSGQASPR